MPEESAVVQTPPATSGQPDEFWLEAWHSGRGWRLGPFGCEAQARAVLVVLEAKAQQLAGHPAWAEGVSSLEPEWLAVIESASWEGLLVELGGASELPAAADGAPAAAATAHGGSPAAAHQSPEAAAAHQGAHAPAGSGTGSEDRPSSSRQQQAAASTPQQPGAASPSAQLPECCAPAAADPTAAELHSSQKPASGYHGVFLMRGKHTSRLYVTVRNPWGDFNLRVPSAEFGGRLADWALLWRAMRLAEGSEVDDSGSLLHGACLPPPASSQLPATLNYPGERYLGDAGLMAFLGRASFAELEARLKQEAAAAAPASGAAGGAPETAGSTVDRRRQHAGTLQQSGSRQQSGRQPYATSTQYIGVRARRSKVFAVELSHGGTNSTLGKFEFEQQAAAVHDLGAVWRQLQRGEPPGQASLNLPELCLAQDAALLGQLRGVPNIPALKRFLESWAEAELPGLLQQLGPRSGQLGSAGEAAGAPASPRPHPAPLGAALQQPDGRASRAPKAPPPSPSSAAVGGLHESSPPAKRARAEDGASGLLTGAATSPFELLAALQPVLEGAGVDPALLSAFEVAFARLGAPLQRVLARAVPRAVEFGGRAATEQLLRDALHGSGCARPCL